MFEGYASVFGSNDVVNDSIEKGAFLESLEKGRPAMFINHDHKSVPVGDWIEMKEDDTGLWGVGKIDMEHKDGPTVYSALKRKAMTGLSIGFTMSGDDFERKEDGGRIIRKADLKEASIVTFPAENNARISSVKQEVWDEVETIRDLERLLRDEFGASKSVAATYLSHAKRIMSGDLTEAEKQIRELKKRLADYETEALISTIKKLKLKS